MSDIPRLDLLRFLRRVQVQQLQQTDRWIAAEEQRAAAVARAERLLPPKDPGYVVSHGIGQDRRPVEVHVGDCGMAKRTKRVTADEARRALANGMEACQFCRPDTALGVL
ncbi:DUF6233 domain-containing protein [Streptomyces lunaelactis]|uniref:DUF6233 domain-containing protein n=1 Tax=Streptomyces lunaelactis TaxID=1535768 RepID=UPI0015856C90|nr:DUF6233 domain-containing protein [Streptomyces lunaelactis]NUK23703.1 hypothetical protein [Streptomyces lunaelactis]